MTNIKEVISEMSISAFDIVESLEFILRLFPDDYYDDNLAREVVDIKRKIDDLERKVRYLEEDLLKWSKRKNV